MRIVQRIGIDEIKGDFTPCRKIADAYLFQCRTACERKIVDGRNAAAHRNLGQTRTAFKRRIADALDAVRDRDGRERGATGKRIVADGPRAVADDARPGEGIRIRLQQMLPDIEYAVLPIAFIVEKGRMFKG